MVVKRGVEVPLAEIKVRASRSSGPGGQHANVTASRVEAVFDVASSTALSEAQKRRVIEKLGPRVTAVAQDARGQARNRELALERLRRRLARRARDAAAPPADGADAGGPRTAALERRSVRPSASGPGGRPVPKMIDLARPSSTLRR